MQRTVKFENGIGDSKEEKERLDGTAGRRKIANPEGKHGENVGDKDGESDSPLTSQTTKQKSANTSAKVRDGAKTASSTEEITATAISNNTSPKGDSSPSASI